MRVEKLTSNYLQDRCDWLNHPKIYNFMNMQYPISYDETRNWHDRVFNNKSRFDFVFINQEDEVCAMTGLTNIDPTNGLAEFYIMVNPILQGQGIGFRATTFTINYAFINYNIHKVYLFTNLLNDRANNLYVRLGFKLEGTLRKHKFKNGKSIDRCIYGLLKEEWKQEAFSVDEIELEF